MSAFFDYPKAAHFGRVLPKNKVYEHARASTRLKQLFVDQVDQITWRYKLAPETINLTASTAVPEIQVFGISLRTPDLDEDVLRTIDTSIPFPIIFELAHNGKRKVMAAYKRPSDADASKWVVSNYFGSPWGHEEADRLPLPPALTLKALYDKLLTTLLPPEAGSGETIDLRVARAEAIQSKRRDVARIKARLAREKQFNKRVAINAELRDATTQLTNLTGRDPGEE
jgi:hypothetical protein